MMYIYCADILQSNILQYLILTIFYLRNLMLPHYTGWTVHGSVLTKEVRGGIYSYTDWNTVAI